MKRLIIVILSTALLLLGASSCSQEPIKDALANTNWTSIQGGPTGPVTLYLKFGSDQNASLGTYEKIIAGKYTYTEPYVTITLGLDGEEGELYGLVSGDKMTLSDGSQSLDFWKN